MAAENAHRFTTHRGMAPTAGNKDFLSNLAAMTPTNMHGGFLPPSQQFQSGAPPQVFPPGISLRPFQPQPQQSFQPQPQQSFQPQPQQSFQPQPQQSFQPPPPLPFYYSYPYPYGPPGVPPISKNSRYRSKSQVPEKNGESDESDEESCTDISESVEETDTCSDSFTDSDEDDESVSTSLRSFTVCGSDESDEETESTVSSKCDTRSEFSETTFSTKPGRRSQHSRGTGKVPPTQTYGRHSASKSIIPSHHLRPSGRNNWRVLETAIVKCFDKALYNLSKESKVEDSESTPEIVYIQPPAKNVPGKNPMFSTPQIIPSSFRPANFGPLQPLPSSQPQPPPTNIPHQPPPTNIPYQPPPVNPATSVVVGADLTKYVESVNLPTTVNGKPARIVSVGKPVVNYGQPTYNGSCGKTNTARVINVQPTQPEVISIPFNGRVPNEKVRVHERSTGKSSLVNPQLQAIRPPFAYGQPQNLGVPQAFGQASTFHPPANFTHPQFSGQQPPLAYYAN